MTTFIGTNNNDIFNGKNASDQVTFSGNAAGYRVDLVNGFVQVVDIDSSDGNTGIDTLTGIEALIFADREYTLTGGHGPNSNGEIRVNTTTALDQMASSIAVLADGSYVVTWMSGEQDPSDIGIYAQRYAADGFAIGSETLVNMTMTGIQIAPDITALADGGYVICWSLYKETSSWEIFAQRYNADGNAVGIETHINTTTANAQYASDITALSDGGYVITWISEGQDGAGLGVYAQRYNASGNPSGGEVRINTHTSANEYMPAISALDNGGYVVCWTSSAQDGSGFGVYAQRYAADGSAIGGETRVNSETINHQYGASITTLANGSYVIAWQSEAQDGSGLGIYTQYYNANGLALGFEQRINNVTAGNQYQPQITALADGGYVVVWTSNGQDGSGDGIYAQCFDGGGNARFDEIQVNSTTTGAQKEPSVSALADGGFVVSWTSVSEDGMSTNVCSRSFDDINNPLATALGITGTAGSDVIHSGAGIQALTGLDGDDTLDGGSGGDILIGGDGDDTYILDAADAITESSGIDTALASFSYNLDSSLENLTLTGTADINGSGNGLDNILIGNIAANILRGSLGNDTLNGGGGSDILEGGAGNDTYILGDADIVTELSGAGIDTIKASQSYTLGNNLENLRLSGEFAIEGKGNSLANALTGNIMGNTLNGLGGDDGLIGHAGNDTLGGGGGNDTLLGGDGNDRLTGGSNSDLFCFSTSLDAATNKDTITDYVIADDTIQLDDSVFRKLVAGELQAANFVASTSGNAVDSNDYILYETDTGKLFYDADGNGNRAKVEFALIGTSSHPTLTAAEFSVI